jgi:hypothetical protein
LLSPRHQYRKNDRDEEERWHISYQMTAFGRIPVVEWPRAPPHPIAPKTQKMLGQLYAVEIQASSAGVR